MEAATTSTLLVATRLSAALWPSRPRRAATTWWSSGAVGDHAAAGGDPARPEQARARRRRRRTSSPDPVIPWYHANRMLSFYAPGWCGEVRNVHREAAGTTSLNDPRFADPVAAAEEAAFCKACARFGFGVYLYHEDETLENCTSSTPSVLRSCLGFLADLGSKACD
ncbi:hypothetical protein E2562_009206 [Oryza meyeriana var. granulata]|uniref:Uncharacterized protein n=1 Tax=Oryza meyeriana var. granulata TaxID=110450 RepID=A0A6G1CZY7_9ORYZ|nr:hypothetical protein E2562_009206 [Oryza meyeriana var. granulata]